MPFRKPDLPPHRRQDYAALVGRALKPGGSYGLVCFRPEGGSGYTGQQVYERGSLGGGLGYSEERQAEDAADVAGKTEFAVVAVGRPKRELAHAPR